MFLKQYLRQSGIHKRYSLLSRGINNNNIDDNNNNDNNNNFNLHDLRSYVVLLAKIINV